MNKIKILSENLANKIAAGEVVERPASVVKELVENAIDAESSRIEVFVKDGGKRRIKVVDNGSGMSREDALLSMEQHATSKIDDESDLFNIATMGFRGEAISSIAAVSKMAILTREADAVEGVEIISEGGVIKDVRAAGVPSGTIIDVRNLFFNTPARKKFLKTTVTEMGHITEYVIRTAIAYPAISFSLKNENSTLLNLPRCGDLLERVKTLIGKEDSAKLQKIGIESEEVKVSGFISPPSVQRSSSSGFYIYVNGRFVRDKVIRHAVLQGYAGFIMKGKYPLAIIFVEVDPGEVDVNVHPAKSEVRFRNSRLVHELVSSAVESTLRTKSWLSEDALSDTTPDTVSDGIKEAARKYMSRGGWHENIYSKSDGGRLNFTPEGLGEKVSGDTPNQTNAMVEGGVDSFNDYQATGRNLLGEPYFSRLEIVGQIGEMYIICQDSKRGMIIIDQHAAYERLAFEELKKGYQDKTYNVQELLIPETVEISPKHAAALEENLEFIRGLGFDVEPFGKMTFVIKSVPAVLGGRGAKEMIKDLAADLSYLPSSKSIENIFDDIAKRIACHSVIRGRRRMAYDEMKDLLKRMDAAGIVPNCPHGRPAHIEIPISEIEKRFERS